MDTKSVTNAFRDILGSWQPAEAASFPEEFALKRYSKKMEVPDSTRDEARREACFNDYVSFDSALSLPRLLPGNWYKARVLVHHWMRSFRLSPVTFTSGSEAHPTHGLNSVESKLMRSKWDCTPDCWDLWARTAYGCSAIKRAARRRFSATMLRRGEDVRSFHAESWRHFKGQRDSQFRCFERMLSRVTSVRLASRFSTVRKNNLKDRPIDVQPLCNMLVQRRIGEGLRSLLKREVGIDLDTLADSHRRRIRDGAYATIDLQNASDSVQLELVRFLFPGKIHDLFEQARTPYTEGLDGDYYVLKKVSAMGCGFTFELMTVILLALGLQVSDLFSVFGDDIIVPNQHAAQVISDLESVGFVVNRDKTFVYSEFRESCGANYHDEHGYLESFDFEYPASIHDCVVIFNKAYRLARSFPQFRRLYSLLARTVPPLLQGPSEEVVSDDYSVDGARGLDKDIQLSTFFWFDKPKGGGKLHEPGVLGAIRDYQLDVGSFRSFYGFVWRPKLASSTRYHLWPSRHIGKIQMYLLGCRVTPDVITGRGSWQPVAYAQVGRRAFRLKTLARLKR